MNNTIILLKATECYTRLEYKKFSKGDAIWGDGSYPKELKRWNIEQKDKAREELAKYRCSYRDNGSLWYVEEYGLEYCECDENGEFMSGSDYDLAEKN